MTLPPTRKSGELLSLRFPPGKLAQRIYELEAENERLQAALFRTMEELLMEAGARNTTQDVKRAVAAQMSRAPHSEEEQE